MTLISKVMLLCLRNVCHLFIKNIQIVLTCSLKSDSYSDEINTSHLPANKSFQSLGAIPYHSFKTHYFSWSLWKQILLYRPNVYTPWVSFINTYRTYRYYSTYILPHLFTVFPLPPCTSFFFFSIKETLVDINKGIICGFLF